MLDYFTELIKDREGFYWRLLWAVPCSIVYSGFFATVFPSLAIGLQLILFCGILFVSATVLTKLTMSMIDSFYFDRSQLLLAIVPVALLVIVIGSLWYLGVYTAM
jgi:hypothetical protein